MTIMDLITIPLNVKYSIWLSDIIEQTLVRVRIRVLIRPGYPFHYFLLKEKFQPALIPFKYKMEVEEFCGEFCGALKVYVTQYEGMRTLKQLRVRVFRLMGRQRSGTNKVMKTF